MIKPEIIEKVRDTADIVEVVGDFVQLKKAGSNYKGFSPFKEEKTPSFSVAPGKNIFKCFATGIGGDSIKFIMEVEGLSYIEAIRYLAGKYNIELEEKKLTKEELEKKDARESLFIVLNFAKEYFQNLMLNSDEGKAIGLSYFKERGFEDKTIETFGLGYSAESWSGLIDEAKKNHYSLDLLEKAGLIIRKEAEGDKKARAYDRYRNRVIFPIHNTTGHVIAFGGRVLGKEFKGAKYINSPETEVYHKSNVLYGLYQAKNFLRNEDKCFLVEGYTDVISMHQSGIKNVVASSGTSLTEGQIKQISRFTKNVTVLYDGDAAGINAAMRGTDMLLEKGLNVRVVTFPEGQDPDSYSQELGGLAFRDFLDEESVDFITFKANHLIKETKDDPLKKAGVIRSVLESIAKIPDSILTRMYLKETSTLLGIQEEVLIDEFNKIYLKDQGERARKISREEQELLRKQAQGPAKKDRGVKAVGAEQIFEAQEKEIIRILISYSSEKIEDDLSFAEYLLEEVADVEFSIPVHQRIVDEFQESLGEGKVLSSGHFIQHEDSEIQDLTINFLAQEHEVSPAWEEKHQLIIINENDQLGKVAYMSLTRLKWRKVRVMLKKLSEEIHILEKEGKENEAIELLEKVMHLKKVEMDIAKILGNVATG